jgi:hypothetical protein
LILSSCFKQQIKDSCIIASPTEPQKDNIKRKCSPIQSIEDLKNYTQGVAWRNVSSWTRKGKERKEDIPGGGAFVILTMYFFKIWHFSSERAMIFSYQQGDKLGLL